MPAQFQRTAPKAFGAYKLYITTLAWECKPLFVIRIKIKIRIRRGARNRLCLAPRFHQSKLTHK